MTEGVDIHNAVLCLPGYAILVFIINRLTLLGPLKEKRVLHYF